MSWGAQWLMGVTCGAMIMALAEALTPPGSGKKVCQFAGGLLLVLVAVGPLARLEEEDWSELLDLDGMTPELVQEELEAQNDLLYESIIAQETAAYIVDKAEELGMPCRAEVVVRWGEEGPVPWSVTLEGAWTPAGQQSVAAMVETDLGIPAHRQYYEEKEP